MCPLRVTPGPAFVFVTHARFERPLWGCAIAQSRVFSQLRREPSRRDSARLWEPVPPGSFVRVPVRGKQRERGREIETVSFTSLRGVIRFPLYFIRFGMWPLNHRSDTLEHARGFRPLSLSVIHTDSDLANYEGKYVRVAISVAPICGGLTFQTHAYRFVPIIGRERTVVKCGLRGRLLNLGTTRAKVRPV